MYLTWQMIIAGFVASCVGFSSICVAIGWCIRIVKGIKKPTDDIKANVDAVDKRVANNAERIKKLEESFDYIVNSINVILKSQFVVMSELARNNDVDGKIAKTQADMNEYIIER